MVSGKPGPQGEMAAMRGKVLALSAFLCLAAPQPLAAQRSCYACNVYDEYGIGAFHVGDVYRNWDGRLVRIQAVDSAQAMILVSLADQSNETRSWITASSVYTDRRFNEKMEAANRTGWQAACALYADALDNDSFFGALLLRGACCDSSQARQNGAPAICR
jgi:hypothetical protein